MRKKEKDDNNISRGARSHVITESDSETRNENEEKGNENSSRHVLPRGRLNNYFTVIAY